MTGNRHVGRICASWIAMIAASALLLNCGGSSTSSGTNSGSCNFQVGGNCSMQVSGVQRTFILPVFNQEAAA
jgi:hypothetical protein